MSAEMEVPESQTIDPAQLELPRALALNVEKIGRRLEVGACRLGYVVVFEECDWGFEETFPATAEAQYGCNVRFLRAYDTTA